MAERTAQKWMESGVKTSIVEYEVWLNYPEVQRLVLRSGGNGTGNVGGNGTEYEAQMYEDVLEQDETTGYEGSLPAFHGYSASGEVEAEYVYVG
jgi:N-acetylated-alpha-linked acidic dipeptidase